MPLIDASCLPMWVASFINTRRQEATGSKSKDFTTIFYSGTKPFPATLPHPSGLHRMYMYDMAHEKSSQEVVFLAYYT